VCSLALVLGRTYDPSTIPALYKGDSNADVCYGAQSAAGDINNIMGAGSQFSIENAQPWIDRLPEHFNLSPNEWVKFGMSRSQWRVSMVHTPPRVIT
jgi:hypothetical protein